MLIKGIGIFLGILMIASIKSSYAMRALVFLGLFAVLLYIGLGKGRR